MAFIKRTKMEDYFQKISTVLPIYPVLPLTKLREYAFFHYKNGRSLHHEVVRDIENSGKVTFESLPATINAVNASFLSGFDELLEKLLDANISKYPEIPFFYGKMAEYKSFQGNFESAFNYARKAFFIAPQFPKTMARFVRLHYPIVDIRQADEVAVKAVKRFPNSSPVLWAVCKNCTTEEQLQRIFEARNEKVEGDTQNLLRSVRPLANAASRVERFDIAMDLYSKAILMEIENEWEGTSVKAKDLTGKNSMEVIADVKDAFDEAGIPFFLCAGTVLGIVREGKPMEHDSDIDVGVWEDDWDPDKFAEVFTLHPKFKLDVPHPRNPKVSILHRSGISLDLFRFYEEDGHYWHNGVFVRWRNTPFSLRTIEVDGLKLKIPDPADKYLRENYGDWRTPVPGFDAFLSSNTEVIWPEYLDYHLVRQAFKYACDGNLDRARENLQKAEHSLQQVPSGKELCDKFLVGR